MKKNITKLITIFALSMISSAAFSGCAKKPSANVDALSKLKDKGYVVVGLDDTFAPMGFKDSKGDIVGFDVDLAKEVFKRTGLQVKFQPIDWSMKETELNSGNIDLIWNGYTITDERKEKVAFTKPYLENRQLIITLANSCIQNKNDLKGKKVAAQNGSSSLDALDKDTSVVSSLKDGKPIILDTNNDAFMDLEAGRVDAVVADEILARYYIKERGTDKYKVLDEDFGSEQYGVGLRKSDTSLVDKVNFELDSMKNDGTCAVISKKWFGTDIVK